MDTINDQYWALKEGENMADFRSMYGVLFRAMTQAIDTLQKAQQTTEEMYIVADDK